MLETMRINDMEDFKEFIIIKGKNKTDEIENFVSDPSNRCIHIKFFNSEKVYPYTTDSVKLEKLLKYNLKSDELCIIKNKIVEIDKLYLSENYAFVYFKGNSKGYSYDRSLIKIEKNLTLNYQGLLEYYKEIAKVKDSDNNEYQEDYLIKQLNRIVIRKNDLLDIFFSKKIHEIALENENSLIFPFGTNLSQRKAVVNAMNNRVSIIQGPPGTGKTQSILNIIANLIIQNKTVAVVSGNNEAIKNVLEKMQKNNYDFLLSLLGRNENKQKFFNSQKDYPPELKEWGRSNEELEELLSQIKEHENNLMILFSSNNRRAKLKQILFEYQHEQKYFSDYLKNQEFEKLKKFNFFHMKSDRLLKLLIDIDPSFSDLDSIVVKIKNLIKYGIYDFKQYKNISQIILDLQNQYYNEKIHEIEKEIEIIDKTLKNKNFQDEISLLEQKSRTYFQAILALKYKDDIRKKFCINDYYKDNNFDEFMKEYPVILATAHSISKSKNQSYKFDYIIIDEASQVELVPGIIALDVAENVVIVGDLKQLSHIPDEKLTLEEYDELSKKYNVSVEYNYYHNSLLASFDLLFNNNIKVMLQEHYRCNNHIIEFCNRKYYEGKLICFSNKENKDPLVLLKTVPGNHMRFGEKAVNKITNIRELDSLMDEDFMKEIGINNLENKTFGFMSPFRGQVNVSKEILYSDFQKDTVHKFQGRESDIILFSSVLDEKGASSKLLGFVDEPHLINVAVSRAVEKFVLVSNVDVFVKANKELGDLIRYMQYYQEKSILCDSKVQSIFDLLYSDYSDKLKEMKKSKSWGKSKYNSENLLYALLDDLLDFSKYKYVIEVKLINVIKKENDFTVEELNYINNKARVDVMIYSNFDKQPVLGIEVDGYQFHDNNPKQWNKDELKNEIFKKMGVPLLRLKTVGSKEREKIEKYL